LAALVTLTVAEANALYKAAEYSGRATPTDVLYGLKKHGNPVCAARLQDYADCYLIRNVCTARQHRHQGWARALCVAIKGQISKPAWLFPRPELTGLYERAGFRIQSPDELPDALRSVWLASKKKYPQSRPMMTEPTGENE